MIKIPALVLVFQVFALSYIELFRVCNRMKNRKLLYNRGFSKKIKACIYNIHVSLKKIVYSLF